MKNLTKQEKIIISIMRGHHLSALEIETAKEQVRIIELILKTK